MAMIKCGDCQEIISDDELVCPNCMAPVDLETAVPIDEGPSAPKSTKEDDAADLLTDAEATEETAGEPVVVDFEDIKVPPAAKESKAGPDKPALVRGLLARQAQQKPPAARDPKKTLVRPKMAPLTTLAEGDMEILPTPDEAVDPSDPKKTKLRKLAAQTKLADQGEEVLELPESDEKADPKKTKLRKLAAQTKLADRGEEVLELPEEKVDPKKTKLRKLAAQTKLADRGEEVLELPEEKIDPKKTQLRPKLPAPTMLAKEGDALLELPEGVVLPKDVDEISEDDLVDDGILGPDLGLEQKTPDVISGVDLISDAIDSDASLGEGLVDLDDDMVLSDDSDSAVDLSTAAAEEGVAIEFPDEQAEDDDAMEVGADDLLDDDDAEVSEDDLLAELGEEPAEKDEALSVAAAEEESLLEEAEVVGKKKKAIVVGEGDDYRRPRRKKVPPKYGRRWVGGTLLGILLAAGAGAAVWYLEPEMITDLVKKSPRFTEEKKEVPKLDLARQAIANGQYAAAMNHLQSTGGTPQQMAARGEARWYKYLKDIGDNKQAFDPNSGEVLTALKDLQDGNHALLAGQVQKAIDVQKDKQTIAEIEKEKRQVSDLLVKSGILPKDDPRLNKLPEAVKEAVNKKSQSDAKLDAVYKTLVDDHKLPINPNDFAKSFSALIADLHDAKQVVAKLEMQLKAKRNLLPAELTKLENAKLALEKTRAQINAGLKAAAVKTTDAQGVADLVASRDAFGKEVTRLMNIAMATLTELNEGKPVKPGKDLAKQLTESAKKIREKAKAPLITSVVQVVSDLSKLSAGAGNWLQNAVQRSALEAQVRMYAAREPFIATPRNKLDTWISLFADRGNGNKAQADQAKKDVSWVLSPHAKSDPATKAKAMYLAGLLMRNEGNFTEAKKALAGARSIVSPLQFPPQWTKGLDRAWNELNDPRVYYLPAAEKHRQEGRVSDALATLGNGLKAIPGNSLLKTARGLIVLEDASAQGKTQSIASQIRADVNLAMKDPAAKAKAYYLLGRLEEALNNLAKAEDSYRAALENVAPADGMDANLYRLALGRVLLRSVSSSAAPRPAPQTVAYIGLALLVGFQQAQQPANNDLPPPEQQRVKKLVSEARVRIKAEDKKKADRLSTILDLAEENLFKKGLSVKVRGQGYMLLGRTLSDLGKRTDGLKVYLKGMKLFDPESELDQLSQIVENHPAFQLPDVLVQASQPKAEVHFGQGVQLYWEKKYAEAELQLQRALAYFRNDARYFYFLGLTQMAQAGKKKQEDAEFSFGQAARLEIENASTTRVNESLERIQGALRQSVDEYRRRAALEGLQ